MQTVVECLAQHKCMQGDTSELCHLTLCMDVGGGSSLGLADNVDAGGGSSCLGFGRGGLTGLACGGSNLGLG